MKKAVLIISVIFLFAINPYALQAQTKAEVLAYIAGMKEKGTVLSGQHCGDGDNIASYYKHHDDGFVQPYRKIRRDCGSGLWLQSK